MYIFLYAKFLGWELAIKWVLFFFILLFPLPLTSFLLLHTVKRRTADGWNRLSNYVISAEQFASF